MTTVNTKMTALAAVEFMLAVAAALAGTFVRFGGDWPRLSDGWALWPRWIAFGIAHSDGGQLQSDHCFIAGVGHATGDDAAAHHCQRAAFAGVVITRLRSFCRRLRRTDVSASILGLQRVGTRRQISETEIPLVIGADCAARAESRF